MIGLVSLNIPCMLVIVTLMEGSPASARAWATPATAPCFQSSNPSAGTVMNSPWLKVGVGP